MKISVAKSLREIYAMLFCWGRSITAAIAIFSVLLLVLPLHAQTLPEIPIAWAPLHPLIYEDENGEVVGFIVDLAQELGQEVGFEPTFFRTSGIAEWGDALRTGASLMAIGTTKNGPSTRQNFSFSNLLFDVEVGLILRAGEEDKIDSARVGGLRIGTIPPAAGSDPALYPNAQMVNYASVNAALFALLAGDIEAISTTTVYLYAAVRDTGLDHRVAFDDSPVLKSERYIAIHHSQAALLEPINAALARMKADGRLATFLARHNIEIPPGAPDVLVVGVSDFPPYSVQNEDGTFSGFAVEAFTDLAERAGLSIVYKSISYPEFSAGPTTQTYDILPQIGVTAARAEIMDFTLAVEQSAFSIFTRSGQAAELSDLDSLVGRAVGVDTASLCRQLAEEHGGLTVRVIEGRSALLEALHEGTVDAILYSSAAMNQEISTQKLTDVVEEVTPPFHISARAPALRRGLGTVRERLNAVIPGYLISDEYTGLRDKWFGLPIFWTQGRIYAVVGTASLVFFGMAAAMGRGRYRQVQRRREYQRQQELLDQEQLHSAELGRLITELERSNGELDNFAYVASHDLKEPLRGIAINADFLLREEVSEKGKDRIARMIQLTTRMEQLISDLLFFSRLGRADKAKQDVDPTRLIDGIKIGLREVLEEANGTIEVAPGLPLIHAEPAKVKVVFQNLIVNGLRYNDAVRKVIRIGFLKEAEASGKTLRNVFFLHDNGIGISEANYEKIFRIFTRLNREADYGRGTGAGLSFVKKIIEEYGGSITLISELKGGTTFYFSFPMVEMKTKERTGRGMNI